MAGGRLYNARKKSVTNPEGVNQYGEVRAQNEPKPKTAQIIAGQYGVGEHTVRAGSGFGDSQLITSHKLFLNSANIRLYTPHLHRYFLLCAFRKAGHTAPGKP